MYIEMDSAQLQQKTAFEMNFFQLKSHTRSLAGERKCPGVQLLGLLYLPSVVLEALKTQPALKIAIQLHSPPNCWTNVGCKTVHFA